MTESSATRLLMCETGGKFVIAERGNVDVKVEKACKP